MADTDELLVLLRRLEGILANGFTGKLTLHCADGHIRHFVVEQRHELRQITEKKDVA